MNGPPMGVDPRNTMENSAMTRPRICPLDSSCRSEFDVAMNVVLIAPTGSITAISSGRLGM